MKKLQIGDKIDIFYYINNTKILDKASITYFDRDTIYTCGHCFPKNAKTNYGELIYSSGFDTNSEKEEIAIIKIKKDKLPCFKNINVKNDYRYEDNINTILINNRKAYKGKILTKVENKLKPGWQNINKNISLNNQITKLEPPYYLVLANNLIKNQGLSGTPWLVHQDNSIKLLGGHIGRTNGLDNFGNNIEIVYVKPVSNSIYNQL
tara:strand:- start:108 stop:728 length:621 start_codon:yes stop_codon:yes gene_type:complete